MTNWLTFQKAFLFCAMVSAFCVGVAVGHPIPDIPVRTEFVDGKAKISVEIDVRCFADDPEQEPYLQHWVLKESTKEEKDEMLKAAQDLVSETVRFRLAPVGLIQPGFSWDFTSKNGAPLDGAEESVMVTGIASVGIPEGVSGYGIEADEVGRFSVVFLNKVDGKEVDRLNVLFPGEESFVLDVSEIKRGSETASDEGEKSVSPSDGGNGLAL